MGGGARLGWVRSLFITPLVPHLSFSNHGTGECLDLCQRTPAAITGHLHLATGDGQTIRGSSPFLWVPVSSPGVPVPPCLSSSSPSASLPNSYVKTTDFGQLFNWLPQLLIYKVNSPEINSSLYIYIMNWCAAIHGVTESDMTEWLNWYIILRGFLSLNSDEIVLTENTPPQLVVGISKMNKLMQWWIQIIC